jgi:hypothetical protein
MLLRVNKGQTSLLVQDQLQDPLNEISDYYKDWKI